MYVEDLRCYRILNTLNSEISLIENMKNPPINSHFVLGCTYLMNKPEY